MAGQGAVEAVDVVVGEVGEALRQRFKTAVVLLLAGGRNGGQGAAMETGPGAEHHGALHLATAVAIFTGQLDGSLVGLGTGITEEHLVGATVLREPTGQLLLLRDLVKV